MFPLWHHKGLNWGTAFLKKTKEVKDRLFIFICITAHRLLENAWWICRQLCIQILHVKVCGWTTFADWSKLASAALWAQPQGAQDQVTRPVCCCCCCERLEPWLRRELRLEMFIKCSIWHMSEFSSTNRTKKWVEENIGHTVVCCSQTIGLQQPSTIVFPPPPNTQKGSEHSVHTGTDKKSYIYQPRKQSQRIWHHFKYPHFMNSRTNFPSDWTRRGFDWWLHNTSECFSNYPCWDPASKFFRHSRQLQQGATCCWTRPTWGRSGRRGKNYKWLRHKRAKRELRCVLLCVFHMNEQHLFTSM